MLIPTALGHSPHTRARRGKGTKPADLTSPGAAGSGMRTQVWADRGGRTPNIVPRRGAGTGRTAALLGIKHMGEIRDSILYRISIARVGYIEAVAAASVASDLGGGGGAAERRTPPHQERSAVIKLPGQP